MNILLGILLILIVADTIMKFIASKKGYDINFIIEVLIDKIGPVGYIILLMSAFGIVIFINSIILTLILIVLYIFIAAKQVTQFKPEDPELNPEEIK